MIEGNDNAKIIFKERLIEAMEREGINQAELSILTGVSPSSICRYLSGHMTPRFVHAESIANALNTSVGWLFGVLNNPNPESVENTPEKSPLIRCPFRKYTVSTSDKTHEHFEKCYGEECPFFIASGEKRNCAKIIQEINK